MEDGLYFLNRELQELRLAKQAADPKVRLIHLTLAHGYARRAWDEYRVSDDWRMAASG